jgi:hypothetical protein
VGDAHRPGAGGTGPKLELKTGLLESCRSSKIAKREQSVGLVAALWGAMNRTSRRRIDRHLRKLYHSDNCFICGSPFRHNSQTVGGIDAQGTIVLAGECCSDKVAVIFTQGVYSKRNYDFLGRRDPSPASSRPANRSPR